MSISAIHFLFFEPENSIELALAERASATLLLSSLGKDTRSLLADAGPGCIFCQIVLLWTLYIRGLAMNTTTQPVRTLFSKVPLNNETTMWTLKSKHRVQYQISHI